MTQDTNQKRLSIVLLFMLVTILFNTIRANSVAGGTTTFRKEARYQLAVTRETLAEQRRINADLQRQIDELRAALEASEPAP